MRSKLLLVLRNILLIQLSEMLDKGVLLPLLHTQIIKFFAYLSIFNLTWVEILFLARHSACVGIFEKLGLKFLKLLKLFSGLHILGLSQLANN